MNALIKGMQINQSTSLTDNDAAAFNTTLDGVLDYFSSAGTIVDMNDALALFKRAFNEDSLLALKALFYFRDIRGGQGRRDMFRNQIKFLADNAPDKLRGVIKFIPEFGRWDDIYALIGTNLEQEALSLIKKQMSIDINADTPSLMAKWLKSENTSSTESRRLGTITRKALGLSSRDYRKVLSKLRKRLDVVERKMTAKEWDKIEYSHVPSQAMLKYGRAFQRNDEDRYVEFRNKVTTGEAKVNTGTLYPHQLVQKINDARFSILGQTENNYRDLNMLWDNLPDMIQGKGGNTLCMVDVSGSMYSSAGKVRPIDAAIALGLYVAERTEGHFKNYFLTFSESPRLVTIPADKTFTEKVNFMNDSDWGYNTNIISAFELILKSAVENNVPKSDMPERLVILSDMQFDSAQSGSWNPTIFQRAKDMYNDAGYELPSIVFWNLNGSLNAFPIQKDEVAVKTLSGFSTNLLSSVLQDDYMTPKEYMLSVLESERYSSIVF